MPNMPIKNQVFQNLKGSQTEFSEEENSVDKVNLDNLSLNHAATCGRSMINNKKPVPMDEASIKKSIKASLRHLEQYPKAAALSIQVYDMMLKNGYSEEDANRASYMFFNDLISNNENKKA